MLRFEIRPQLVQNKDIGIDGLDRQKTAEPHPPAPSDDQINAGDVRRGEAVFLLQIPIPAVIDKEVNPDLSGSEFCPLGIGQKFFREVVRQSVPYNKEFSISICQLFHCIHAGFLKGLFLDSRPFCVIHRKTIQRELLNSQGHTKFIELEPGSHPVTVTFRLVHISVGRPPSVPIGYDADVLRYSLKLWHYSLGFWHFEFLIKLSALKKITELVLLYQ